MGLFQQIAEESQKRNLRFLVIGGLAVNFYGYSRETGDLDLLVNKAVRPAWLSLFHAIGYQAISEREVFAQLAPPKTGEWPVDLMFVNEETFQKMLPHAIEAEVYGARVLVPALEHLLALKLHALKHTHLGRVLKDFLDVENLIRVNKLDINSATLRNLFLKYGNVDLYEKVSRACKTE